MKKRSSKWTGTVVTVQHLWTVTADCYGNSRKCLSWDISSFLFTPFNATQLTSLSTYTQEGLKEDVRQQHRHTGKVQTGIQAVPKMPAVQCVLTNAGAPIQQVGAIVMETTSALAVVPAGQVDTAGVVVALDQALCTLVDIWGQTCRRQNTNPKHCPQSCGRHLCLQMHGTKKEVRIAVHYIVHPMYPIMHCKVVDNWRSQSNISHHP